MANKFGGFQYFYSLIKILLQKNKDFTTTIIATNQTLTDSIPFISLSEIIILDIFLIFYYITDIR